MLLCAGASNKLLHRCCTILQKGKLHRFDRGAYRNLQSVLGENPFTWLLPLGDPSSGPLSSSLPPSPLTLHNLPLLSPVYHALLLRCLSRVLALQMYPSLGVKNRT